MRYILGIFFICFFGACGTMTLENKSSVSYDMIFFKEIGKECAADSNGCAKFEVSYPVFAGIDDKVSKNIQNKINAHVSISNEQQQVQTLEEIGKEFVKSYDDFVKEVPGEGMPWYYKANTTVNILTDTLISIVVREEYFTGGAHGGMGTYFINVNPKTGKDFTLDNFFKSRYKSELVKKGEQIFRKEKEIADAASLKDFGYEFPEDKFELSKNYGFTSEGIVFFYNSYDIAPYVAGSSEIIITYEEVKDWIKK